MNEELPVPCQHCKSTGLSHGDECRECRGKRYRVFVRGGLQPVPRDEKPKCWQDRPQKRGRRFAWGAPAV
jgi:hypothetical protein